MAKSSKRPRSQTATDKKPGDQPAEVASSEPKPPKQSSAQTISKQTISKQTISKQTTPTSTLSAGLKNKTKVLLFSTRGITSRPRHLMDDLMRLMPHAKRESKLDTKDTLSIATEMAELRSCDTVMLFEARKRMDTYIWLAKSPFGPSVKFHLQNLHTMHELNFPGNNLMHSRPILAFDTAFDSSPFLKLLKEMFTHAFSSPLNHRRTKPFVDHLISLSYLDGRIWFRHYQIVDAALNEKLTNKNVDSSLVEIGPRFVLNPIKCFSGAFQGAVIWENPAYVSPNMVRRLLRKRQVDKVERRTQGREKRRKYEQDNAVEMDEVDKTFR